MLHIKNVLKFFTKQLIHEIITWNKKITQNNNVDKIKDKFKLKTKICYGF